MAEKLTKQNKLYSDFLEVFIVLAFLFLIISIYVPRAIWDEEEVLESISHANIENMYDVQYFYNELLDEYSVDGLKAIKVVNSVRDSLTGDSTYLGEQSITLDGESFMVKVPVGYEVGFDTTFGFALTRRDTVIDTTVTIVMFSEMLSRNDTTYIQNKQLGKYLVDENFISIVEKVPNQRIEVVSYYDSYMPDSSMYYCPVSNQSYEITVKDEGKVVRVGSPIKEPVVRSRYLIFSFKAENHGFIEDGSKSWDR